MLLPVCDFVRNPVPYRLRADCRALRALLYRLRAVLISCIYMYSDCPIMYIIFVQNTSLSYIWKSLDYVSSEVSHPANDDLVILLVVPPSG